MSDFLRRNRHFCLLFSVSVCVAQSAKVYTIDTVAGGAVYDNLPATATPLSSPNGLWLDRDGALWVADTGNQVIRKIDPVTGVMRVVVGGGTVIDDSVPVPAGSVQLNRPGHIVGDAAGSIYFTDSANNRVRKLTPDGLVTTVVGTGQAGYAGDGAPARLAKLNAPTGLVFDAAGNLYIADAGNCRIRRVDTSGNISTIAGSGQCGNSGDGGPALKAALPSASFPHGMNGLAFDSKSNLYVAAREVIRRIDGATGIITTVVGIPNNIQCVPFPDGTLAATSATCATVGLFFDQDDNLYFTYVFGLAKVTAATGLVTTYYGGPADGAGVVRDSAGRVVFASFSYGRILQMSPASRQMTVIAGTDDPFDGPGRLAVLIFPRRIATDVQGNVYVAEQRRGRVRRIDAASNQVTTVVGGGTTPLADGVQATAAKADEILGVHVDSRGNIFFSQYAPLWKVDAATGKISRVAGQQSERGYSGDGGPALQATFGQVGDVVTDAAGNVFIIDAPNNRVRKVDAATGIITTIAGNGSSAGPSGDGGPATAAAIGEPACLAFDRSGQLLIGAGQGIRRVDLSTGLITTVQARSRPDAPLGKVGGASGVTVDQGNNIFFISGLSILKVQASDSLLVTVAGSSIEGFFGDGGLASLARLSPAGGGITADPAGNIYVADTGNGRVRKLSLTVVLPEMAVSPATLFFTQLQGSSILTGQQFTVSSANGLPFDWTLQISTSAGGNWLYASKTSGSAPATILLTVDASKLGAGSYRGTVTVKGAGTSNASQTVDVMLTVQAATGAALGVSQQYLNFQAVQGGTNPPPQTLSISNVGSGTLSWSATAETSSGGQWLRISSGLGTAPSTVAVSADITGLAQGTYQGRVVLRNLVSGASVMISVVLNITRSQPILLPTQTGFLFVGVEGSLVIGPQSFAIQNAGQGKMDWQIQVNLPAGGDWLRVSPTSGTSDAAVQAAPTVTLLVDPGKLRAGVSVGLLTITASGALNAPQTGIVLVNMLARGSLPMGTTNPLGLIFTAASGASGALTQGISIASTGGQALQYLARTQTQAGGNWLSVTPEQGVLLSSAETAALSVQAQPSGLSAGVYVGSLILSFGTGVTQEVAVALVVSPVATSDANQAYDRQPDTWHLTPEVLAKLRKQRVKPKQERLKTFEKGTTPA